MGVFALTILPAAFLAGRQLVLRLPTSGRQTLLANRFNLKVRRGTRELDVYALVLARPDGKLGPSWAGGGFSDTA